MEQANEHKPIIRTSDYHRLFQVRAGEPITGQENSLIIEGKAITFNEETLLCECEDDDLEKKVKIFEKIDSTALDKCDMSDCFMKYNHSDDIMVMARTKSKTLTLTKKEDGLYITANLAPTTAGKDLYELVKRGDIDKMSFAFTIGEEDEKDSEDGSEIHFTVRSITKLYDVAAVPLPAYENTSLFARRREDAETSLKRLEERRKADRDKELSLARARAGIYLK
jgi:HK97 family phage prohead protease